jgi:TonB family protein
MLKEDPIREPVERTSIMLPGPVVVQALIGANGKVEEVALARPAGAGVDEQIVEACRNRVFRPGTLEGVPVAVVYNIRVLFDYY